MKKYIFIIGLVLLVAGAFSVPSAHATVPRFAINFGDYSACNNGWWDGGNYGAPDGGNYFWTPAGGGLQPGGSGDWYSTWNSYTQGDCVQAAIQGLTAAGGVFDQDFRIGIQVGSGGNHLGCSYTGAWYYTPWASAGGGDSGLAAAGFNGSWSHVVCARLNVETRPLPDPVGQIYGVSFNAKIQALNGYQTTSYASSDCNITYTTSGNCNLTNVNRSEFEYVNIHLTSSYLATVKAGYGWKRKSALVGGGVGDCYDSNSNAYPGQTQYWNISRGDGSFDYDCDGGQNSAYGTALAGGLDSAGFGDGCTGTDGWLTGAPACGASASYGGYQWVSSPCSMSCCSAGIKPQNYFASTLPSIFSIKTAYAIACCDCGTGDLSECRMRSSVRTNLCK